MRHASQVAITRKKKAGRGASTPRCMTSVQACLTCVSVCAGRTGLHREVCVAEQAGEAHIGCRAGKRRWLHVHQGVLGGSQG